MKILIKILKWFAIVFLSIIALIYIFDYGYLLRAVRVTYLTGHKTAFFRRLQLFQQS